MGAAAGQTQDVVLVWGRPLDVSWFVASLMGALFYPLASTAVVDPLQPNARHCSHTGLEPVPAVDRNCWNLTRGDPKMTILMKKWKFQNQSRNDQGISPDVQDHPESYISSAEIDFHEI